MAMDIPTVAVGKVGGATLTFNPAWSAGAPPVGSRIVAAWTERSSSPTLTPPAGWALLPATQLGSGGAIRTYFAERTALVAAGEDLTAALTFTSSTGTATLVTLMAVTGGDNASPYVSLPNAANFSNTSGTAGTLTEATPAGVPCVAGGINIHVISEIFAATTGHTHVWEAGVTEVGDQSQGSSGQAVGFTIAAAGQTTSNARTVTPTANDSSAYSAGVLAMRPAGGGTTGPPTKSTNPTISASLQVSGHTVTGKRLTCTPGTYVGADTVTRQWQRNGVDIAGATGLTYDTVADDEGSGVTVNETATNTNGNVVGTSNTIVVDPPLMDGSLSIRLSGGATNQNPTLATGGAMSNFSVGDDLAGSGWDNVNDIESRDGDTEYHVYYVFNPSAVQTATTTRLWMPADTTDPNTSVQLAPGASVNTPVTATASEDTAPTGVTWSAPIAPGGPTDPTPAGAIDLGDIPPLGFGSFRMRRTVAAGAAADAADRVTLVIRTTPN